MCPHKITQVENQGEGGPFSKIIVRESIMLGKVKWERPYFYVSLRFLRLKIQGIAVLFLIIGTGLMIFKKVQYEIRYF